MSPSSENRKAWTAVVLVFNFMLINFADKAVIGLASVPIMRDLGLDHRQFGLLGSAFFLLFSLSGVVVGFLANRIGTKVLMLVMGLVWAAALLPMSVVASFQMLLASRVVLGAAEGPAFPVAVHSVYKWFGNQRRALPTSVVASGAAFGTGLAAPLITWIIVHYGWHAAFGTLGGVGLVWACLWLVLAEEGPIDRDATAGDVTAGHRVPYRRLLLSRTAIGVFLAGFAAYWIIALNIVWLANYLINAVHMSATQAGWVITLPSIMQMVFAPLCAYLSMALSRRGFSSRISRGVLGSICVVVAGVALASVPFAGSGAIEIALVGVSCSIGSVIFTLGTTLIGEISPASQRGAMLGITNSIHTLAGLCAPFLMGLLVDINADTIAGFRTGYLYAGALVALLGALAAALIDPEADLLNFQRKRGPKVQPIYLTFLNGPDVERIALTDTQILAAVERGLQAQGQKQVVIEPRVHLVPQDSSLGHFNVLRGAVLPLGLAGVKIVGDFVNNYKVGLPSELAMLNLFDPATGVPTAILDATSLTDMRTGAMTALGGKFLARKNSKVLGHIGARGTSYWNIRLLSHFFEFDEIRVHSRRPESRAAFAKKLTEDLGRPVVAVDNWEDCVRDADIVVEASRLPEPQPLLKTEWIKAGALVVPYGTMSAVELSLTDIMSKVVVDDWGQCRKGLPYGALRRHVDSDKLTEQNLHAELGQIVAGVKPGRENEQETILFWHRGLSLSDIALGHAMLEKAKALGVGQRLRFA